MARKKRGTTTKAYKRNFLDKVVIRFDFDDVDLVKLKDFSALIQDKFPYQEQKDGRTGAVKIDLKKGQVVENQFQAIKTWEFLSPSKKKKLTVASNFVAVEYLNRSYTDKAELFQDCKELVLPFLKHFEISTINRLGLRYVNGFDLNFIKKEFEWKTYFKPELLGNIEFARKRKVRVARSMNSTLS